MKYKILTTEEIDRLMTKQNQRTAKVAEQIIISKGYHDPNFFADFFLPHLKIHKRTKKRVPSAPYQKQMQLNMKILKLYNAIFSRWAGKTTTSLIDTIHDVCYELEPSTIIRCPDTVGKKFMQKLRNEFLSNRRILQYFGDLLPNVEKESEKKRQTQKIVQFTNGCDVEYVSKKQWARWSRATKLKVDDPQEHDDVKNPKRAAEMVSYFFSSLFPLLDDDTGKCIVMGTILSPDCFVNVLATDESRGFKTDMFPAIEDIKMQKFDKGEEFVREDGSVWIGNGKQRIVWGVVTWPWRRTLATLDARMQTMGYEEFMQEMQHKPMDVKGKKLIDQETQDSIIPLEPIETNAHWIEWLNIYRRPDDQPLSFGLDTSTGNGEDASSIVARNNAGEMYLSYKGMVEPDVLADILNDIIKEGYEPKRKSVGIENNNTGIATIKQAKNQSYRRYNDIYRQKNLKTNEETESKNIGRNTNNATRPIMQTNYKRKVGTEYIEFDKREKDEMKTLILDENGTAKSPAPFHDDLCLGDMICMMMIENNDYNIVAA